MNTNIDSAIDSLVKQCANEVPQASMQYAQAVLSLAHAKQILSQIELNTRPSSVIPGKPEKG